MSPVLIAFVLCWVFDDVHLHLAEFGPRTMLDFGSRLRTAIWSARELGLQSLACAGVNVAKHRNSTWKELIPICTLISSIVSAAKCPGFRCQTCLGKLA